MTIIRTKTVRQLNEKDLRSKILDSRTDLAKLRVDSSKGTLRKESGKLKPIRHNIARMLTRLNEMEKEK
jgi:large subunit ribosomal protein L29